MAKRYFPAHARVADDLACIGCGYNLRTLMANANCPECGQQVGSSLFLLARPRVVADNLGGAAKTHLAMFILALPLLGPGSFWPLIVAMAVIGLSIAWRCGCQIAILRGGAVARLPVIGPRLRAWAGITSLELLAALGCLVTTVVVAKSPALQGTSGAAWIRGTFLAWMLITMSSPVVANWFGAAMTLLLGYNWMIVEFRIHQVIAIAGLGCALLLGFLLVARGGVLVSLLAGFAWLGVGFAIIATWIALTHLSNAASEASETWDELIDSERIELVANPPSSPKQRERPPIQLAPAKTKSSPSSSGVEQ